MIDACRRGLVEARPLAVAVLLGGLGIAAFSGVATAQDQTIAPLLDRIDRLERDVNMLQREVYRNDSTSPSGTPMAPSPPPDSQTALGSEVRLSHLEDQMRTLNGQIEEINYTLDQLKRRLDTLSSDVDQRFAQLGGPPATGPRPPVPSNAPPPPPGASRLPPEASASRPPPGAGADLTQPASSAGVLGTISSTGAAGPAPARDAAPPPQQQAALPPPADAPPQDLYNYAFGLLRRADYPGAESALKSFIQRYPNDALAGNAQYWLGETYYVRKDYEDAATAFAVGYQKYPKSGKAADNLLKLGMALGNLGKKGEACAAFTRIDRDFPTAPANVKDRVTAERQQIGC